MTASATNTTTNEQALPPLILHPFGGGSSTQELLEGSRANLALEGLLSMDTPLGNDKFELERRVMVGRYQEIKMLLFLGKDISRWLQQCVDFVRRSESMDQRLSEQSFASLVVEDPPAGVREKLERWGVSDRRAVFSRAIGIYSIFAAPPPVESLSPTFLNHYHRYADHAYICFQHLRPFQALTTGQFQFEIYASEEYSRMLSEQWEHS